MNTNIINNLNENGFNNIKTYEDIITTAINMLNDNDELFINMVNELDSWNGYADGFRCYDMNELNDFYCDCKVSDFLQQLTKDFNYADDYFYYSIYGLESTNDIIGLYRDNTDTGEVLDNIIENYSHLYMDYDEDFKILIESAVNWDND